jgi:hypothetical protein
LSQPKPRPRPASKFSTNNIVAALERKYPQDKGAYGILYEVGNGTGFACNRHCDALVMSLWPSRGLTLKGFEFKASRSDFLKELSDPAKAEAIQRYCDEFWLAVTDESIVRLTDGELPVSWGLMALDARGSLRVIREAPKLEPVPLDREMLAAIFRRVSEPIHAVSSSEISNAVYKAVQEERRRHQEEIAKVNRQRQASEAEIHKFERLIGCSLDGMSHVHARWGENHQQNLADSIRYVLTHRAFDSLRHAETIRQEVDRHVGPLVELSKSLGQLVELLKSPPVEVPAVASEPTEPTPPTPPTPPTEPQNEL